MWLVLLVIGYFMTAVWCSFGLPKEVIARVVGVSVFHVGPERAKDEQGDMMTRCWGAG